MYSDFLDRTAVIAAMQKIVDADPPADDRRDGENLSPDDYALVDRELSAAIARELRKSSGPRTHDVPDSDERRGATPVPLLDEQAFISSDHIVSLAQSALDLCVRMKPSDSSGRRTDSDEALSRDASEDALPMVSDEFAGLNFSSDDEDDRRIFDQFSQVDIRWVKSKIAEGIRNWNGKHPFNELPANACAVPDAFRLVVVGDWGTGLPRARSVAKYMREHIEGGLRDKRVVHVAHLGDVYYSGWPEEYVDRFLADWPVNPWEAESIGSWCLNGNHDMYSGGYGYFQSALVDSRFAKWQANGDGPSSFFSIQHPRWQILGLDTAWEDASLCAPQPAWLRATLEENARCAQKKKTLLLSHHQFVSAYEQPSATLVKQIQPILSDHPVTAWFWGHEHRCMHFAAQPTVTFPRCLGDGGVPVYQFHKTEDAYPLPGTYEHRAVHLRGLEPWALMGFAVLDFDGDEIVAKYYNEHGVKHAEETIR